MNDSSIRFAGWVAYANGALSIGIFLTLIAYFVFGGMWGTVNDSISVIWALTFIPILVLLSRLDKTGNVLLAQILAIAGSIVMVVFAFLQSLLVLGVVRFEQTFLIVVTLGGILGLVLLLNGFQARNGQFLPSGLSKLLIIFGAGYIVSTTGFWLGGWENPLAAAGYLASVLTGPAWAFWLGKLLLNGRLISQTLLSTP